MQRFIEGDERGQLSLLPTGLEEFVEEDNPERPSTASRAGKMLSRIRGSDGIRCITVYENC